MGHPVIDEMNRCYSLQHVRTESFRRWQRVLRDEVNPIVDEHARLKVEVEELKAALAAYESNGIAAPGVSEARRMAKRKQETETV